VYGGIWMRNEVADARQVRRELTGYRLIPSRFPPISIYAGLVANDRIDSLVEIENLTNPRLKAAQRLTSVEDLEPSNRLQNWNHAPFAYSNPEGSLFFGADRPCLELASDKQTALAISVARRQRFLSRTDEPAVGLDMRMLATPICGTFLDLRHLGAGLTHDERRAIGMTVPTSTQGVLYTAPERPSGECVAVLDGGVLGRSLQANHYRFLWDGQKMISLYAFDNEGRAFSPDMLSSDEDILAA